MLGLVNATFWEVDILQVNNYYHGFIIYCIYKVPKIPLFEETPVNIAKPNCNGYYMYGTC